MVRRCRRGREAPQNATEREGAVTKHEYQAEDHSPIEACLSFDKSGGIAACGQGHMHTASKRMQESEDGKVAGIVVSTFFFFCKVVFPRPSSFSVSTSQPSVVLSIFCQDKKRNDTGLGRAAAANQQLDRSGDGKEAPKTCTLTWPIHNPPASLQRPLIVALLDRSVFGCSDGVSMFVLALVAFLTWTGRTCSVLIWRLYMQQAACPAPFCQL